MFAEGRRWGSFRGALASALLAAAALAGSAETAAAVTAAPGNTHFPRYKELEPNVAFWSDVFTKWTSKQIAFHDVEHLDLVYSVLSIDDIVARLPDSQQDAAIQARRKAEGERISAMLQSIADGHARTEEERRILKAIARIGQEPSYAATLADQVRSQRGLGDKFCDAAARAESYRPMMTRILAMYDVPEELLALPLVESGYKIGARSSAGASGIWQFIASTGRIYDLEQTSTLDERRDPQRSTDAAARMLRKTYDTMGSWPLAITSYNHGPGGIARAVKDMGTTHFGVISKHYKGKSFGFASRNYYAEFLAAVDAMKRVDELCGQITVAPYQPDTALLGASASIRDLARASRTSIEDLAELNPALSDACVRGSLKVPRGYQLNLPRGTRNDFEVAFGHVDRTAPSAPTLVARAEEIAPRPERVHKVARGESLGSIARHYGTTETTLLWMNNLRSAASVKVGQNLKVPGDRASEPVAVADASDGKPARPPFSKSMTTTAGVIAAGEAASLAAQTAAAAAPAAVIQKNGGSAPAARGTVVAAPAVEVASLDPKAAPSTIEKSDANDAEPVLTAEHKVGRGQTLSQIASMYRMKVDDLMAMNGISDASSLQAGQTIKVRASGTEIVSASTVGRTYKVKGGDTLWSVARANDTSVETLKRFNPRIASAGLKAGDTIKVPSAGAVSVASAAASRDDRPVAAASASPSSRAKASAKAKVSSKASSSASAKASFRSHRVQKGQTLSSIAQRYKTSVETLKRINGIRDARSVQVGKTLKVPL